MNSVYIAIVLPAVCMAAVSSYLNADSRASFAEVFQSAQPYVATDLANAMYSMTGLSALGIKVSNEKALCDMLNKDVIKRDTTQLYYTISASHAISNCQIKLPSTVEENLNKVIVNTQSTTKQIYHSVYSKVHLNLKVDSAKVASGLKNALKNDDSPLSHSYAFYTSALVKADMKYFHDLIEDVIAQADEVDDKYMQFEAGLYTTSMMIDSAYKLSTSINKEPICLKNKIHKFTQYFVNRLHTDSARNAASLVSIFKTLSSNSFHIPTVISLESGLSISSEKPIVKVKVCSLMGTSLGVSVVMHSVKSVKDSAVIVSKQNMPASTDSSFQLDLMSAKPAPGFYALNIKANGGNSKALLGLESTSLMVKVTAKVDLSDVKISVAERDHTSDMLPVSYPSKLSTTLEADNHQSIEIQFKVISKYTNEPLDSVHQTFVSFTHQKTKQIITFIAEPNLDVFKFKIDMHDKEKEFDYTSGTYDIQLIVGDSIIENTIVYTIASIKMDLKNKEISNTKVESNFGLKREITHTFRVPDKRPSAGITFIFNILVLVPAVILVVLWLKNGINISNITEVCSVSALLFQISLCSIFVLYYYYWVQLNMFDTVRYLSYIAVPTFIFGNRVLKCVASKRK